MCSETEAHISIRKVTLIWNEARADNCLEIKLCFSFNKKPACAWLGSGGMLQIPRVPFGRVVAASDLWANCCRTVHTRRDGPRSEGRSEPWRALRSNQSIDQSILHVVKHVPPKHTWAINVKIEREGDENGVLLSH